MSDPFGIDQKSDLQRQILRVYDSNPDMSPKHIADRCNCSSSYVRDTINEYRSAGGFL